MPSFESEVFGIILSSSLVIKSVLLILLFFSLFSWAIIFMKLSSFSKVQRENRVFLKMYWEVENLLQLRKAVSRLKQSVLVKVFLAGVERLDGGVLFDADGHFKSLPESAQQVNVKILDRTLRRTAEEQLGSLEHYLSFLATTGNVTPFIGLFGTVLGIIQAFHEIGRQGTANIAAVAPGVSEALVATAGGLLVAIPAVVAFNYFMSRLRDISSEVESFSTDFLSHVEERVSRVSTSGVGQP
jgi:biopolymer transport protein TolQ